MSVRQNLPHVLWSMTTRNSVISCELEALPNGACELRVYQSGEVAVREVFQSQENAERYAVALRDKLLPLADDGGDAEMGRRAS